MEVIYVKKTTISLSFDDGREDWHRVVYRIMKQYDLKATLHVTTGYVDGTWKTTNWDSSNGPISINNLIEMKKYGFEIASHGNQHKTEKDDLIESIDKLKNWKLIEDEVGFSIPTSKIEEQNKNEFYDCLKDNNVIYVRGGRNPQCYSFISKICFFAYKLTKCQYFYSKFNRYNCIDIYPREKINPYDLCTVVIRREDKAESVIRFIRENINKGKWIIFMLHSIQDENENNFRKDSWYWDLEKFEMLCHELRKMVDSEEIDVLTIKDIIENANH